MNNRHAEQIYPFIINERKRKCEKLRERERERECNRVREREHAHAIEREREKVESLQGKRNKNNKEMNK